MVRSLLLSVMLPGVIAVVGVLAGHFPGPFRRGGRATLPGEVFRHGLAAAAIGIGFACAFYFIEGLRPAWPPVARWHVLSVMGLCAAGIGLLHGFWSQRWFGTAITALLLGAAAAYLLQPLPVIEHHPAWKLGLGIAVAAWFLIVSPLSTQRTGHALPLVLMVTCTALSVILVEARSAKFGQMVGSLAAMAGMLMAAGMIVRSLRLDGGAAAVLAMLLPSWMVVGIFYDGGDVPRAAFVMVYVAPLLAWAGVWPPVARRGGWLAWALTIGPPVLLCGAAIAVALLGSEPPPPDPYDDYW